MSSDFMCVAKELNKDQINERYRQSNTKEPEPLRFCFVEVGLEHGASVRLDECLVPLSNNSELKTAYSLRHRFVFTVHSERGTGWTVFCA